MKKKSFLVTIAFYALFSLTLHGADNSPQVPVSLSWGNTFLQAWVTTFGAPRTQLRLLGQVQLTQETFHTGYDDLLQAAAVDQKPGENYLLRLEQAIQNGEKNDLHADLAQLQATLALVDASDLINKQVRKTVLDRMRDMNKQTGEALKKSLSKKQARKKKTDESKDELDS